MEKLKINKNTNKATEFNFGKTIIKVDNYSTIEANTAFDEDDIKGWYKEAIYNEFKIGYGELSTNKNASLTCNYYDKIIEMIFSIDGSASMKYNGSTQVHDFQKNTHTVLHCKNNYTEITFKDTYSTFVLIQLNASFFEDLIPSESTFNDFKSIISESLTGCIKNVNNTISPKMKLIIEELKTSSLEGPYRKLFIHSKVLELLLLQLDQYKTSEASSTLSENEIIKINNAKEYLLKNYKKPITIQKLAKAVGTNEFTLKKGFKVIFGETVFSCISNLRMNKAKQLLLNNNLSISQVSEIIGYKNPQHFSTAFKKKFGYVPSKLKK